MKKAIKTLWEGLKAVFSVIVDWVATLFGMKDDSKYSKDLRRLVSASFTIVVMLWAVCSLVDLGFNIYDHFRCTSHSNNEEESSYLVEQISDNIGYYTTDSEDKGYLLNATGRMLLNNIVWISKPLEGDSLVCYSNGNLRGYFHMRDGRLVIAPSYRHAWIFSEGLAAVEQNGQIKIINTKGQVVIDKPFGYNSDAEGFVFHKGHCALYDSTGLQMGLIDRDGNWVLPPIYNNIVPRDTFWVVSQGNRQAILTFSLDTVMPMSNANFSIRDSSILATFNDHTISTYTLQGKLITAMQINEVEQLMYDTREVVYPSAGKDDDSYISNDPYTRRAVATCYQYTAEWGWYGLMSPTGKVITPPSYVRIEAVDKDLYLCETDYGRGILLNSNGQRVK